MGVCMKSLQHVDIVILKYIYIFLNEYRLSSVLGKREQMNSLFHLLHSYGQHPYLGCIAGNRGAAK